MIDRLKAMWRQSGPATYEEVCGIEPGHYDKADERAWEAAMYASALIVGVFVLLIVGVLAGRIDQNGFVG